MEGDRSAEFLAPDLSSCKCAGGLNRKIRSRGAHTCFGRWLLGTGFGLLPRGNRSGDETPKDCPEQMSHVCSPATGSELRRAGLPSTEALHRPRVQAEAGTRTLAGGRGRRQGPDFIAACRCACSLPVCKTGRGPGGVGLREERAGPQSAVRLSDGPGSLAEGRQSADAVPEVRRLPPGLC